jgi:hypothetical protein
MLAMERGEIDGVCGLDVSSLRAMRPNWIGSGEVNLLVQAALEPRKDLLDRSNGSPDGRGGYSGFALQEHDSRGSSVMGC